MAATCRQETDLSAAGCRLHANAYPWDPLFCAHREGATGARARRHTLAGRRPLARACRSRIIFPPAFELTRATTARCAHHATSPLDCCRPMKCVPLCAKRAGTRQPSRCLLKEGLTASIILRSFSSFLSGVPLPQCPCLRSMLVARSIGRLLRQAGDVATEHRIYLLRRRPIQLPLCF